MSDMRILMTPAELEESATFLEARLEAIEAETKSLKNNIDDVSSRWEGLAKNSFITQFESELYPIMSNTLPDVINGIASQLRGAAQAISETDSQLSQAFSGGGQ